jgi:hypothetical protein
MKEVQRMTLDDVVKEVQKISNKSNTLKWGVSTKENTAVLCCGYLHSNTQPSIPILCFIFDTVDDEEVLKVTVETLQHNKVTNISSCMVKKADISQFVIGKLKEVYA